MKYRKKPVVIEALQWNGENLRQIRTFIDGKEPITDRAVAVDAWDRYENMIARDGLIIRTLEGQHIATIGDFIIKGVKGEFYPCKPDIFEATYEPVKEGE